MINVKNLFIMGTTILNFKKVELVAESKEAAIAQMTENYFGYCGDATQAYNNWKKKQAEEGNGVTERSLKEFMLSYLQKKVKSCPDSGFIIVLDSHSLDTRQRPYHIEDVKSEGKRKFKTTYKWVDEATKTVVCQTDTNKAEAKNILKELYKSGAYKGDANLVKTKDVIEGNAVVATAKYTPSKNAKKGTYLIFGIER